MAVQSRGVAWSAEQGRRMVRKCPLLVGVLTILLLLPAGSVRAQTASGTAVKPAASTSSNQNMTVSYSRDGKVSYKANVPATTNIRSGGRSGHAGSAGRSVPATSRTASPGPTPNNVIYNLTLQDGNTTTYCTGFMISASVVATAGHCVYDPAAGQWAQAVTIAPARNENSYPYGTCGWTVESTVTEWTDYGDEDYDYGAIKLNCTIGNSTGWFGMYWDTNDGDYIAKPSFLTGYPGSGKPDGQMWSGSGSITAAYTYQLEYLSVGIQHGRVGR